LHAELQHIDNMWSKDSRRMNHLPGNWTYLQGTTEKEDNKYVYANSSEMN